MIKIAIDDIGLYDNVVSYKIENGVLYFVDKYNIEHYTNKPFHIVIESVQ